MLLLGQNTHLAAGTAPSGQVRVTAARCPEMTEEGHHPRAAAHVERVPASKTSQRIQIMENRVMHRVEVCVCVCMWDWHLLRNRLANEKPPIVAGKKRDGFPNGCKALEGNTLSVLD